jgi:predicted dehydrogenase
LFRAGKIGKIINIRAQYGHGGRVGYEKEWRGNSKMAGGGELTDQGVHLIDLIQWFCGTPENVFALLQTAFWPIKPSEDNGFALLKFRNGIVSNFHSSWTQWKNLFNFDIFGTKGSLSVHGLGGSYGTETLTSAIRKSGGGVPELTCEKFEGADESWKLEWNDFLSAISKSKKYLGTAEEGLNVMKTLDALYQSHKLKKGIHLQ